MTEGQKYVQDSLTNEESKLCKKIYGLLEKHITKLCGSFNESYAMQNTDVTALTMDIIQNVRNQVQFQEQIKGLGL